MSETTTETTTETKAETKKPKTRKKRVSAPKVDTEAVWREKLDQGNKGNKAPKAYAMDKVFLLDDRVEHQIFGVGVVVSLIPPDKINVYFQDGLRMMKCGV
jgi:hypothetical protein